jgi:hypothetical protein
MTPLTFLKASQIDVKPGASGSAAAIASTAAGLLRQGKRARLHAEGFAWSFSMFACALTTAIVNLAVRLSKGDSFDRQAARVSHKISATGPALLTGGDSGVSGLPMTSSAAATAEMPISR